MNKHKLQETNWDWEIKTETSWLGTSLKELYSYKDLMIRLTRKEFLSSYQQTLLGPFWVLLQPLLTVFTFVLVFNNVIGVSTNGIPPFLFNLIGITLWNLFSEVFLNTSKTFIYNVQVFSKVYFPRIIVSLSTLGLQLLLFGIQLLLLIVACIFYVVTGHYKIDMSHILLIFPAIIVTAGIAFGAGLILSVLSAKYRDLLSLMNVVIRLLMFVCPVFYSLAMVPKRVKWIVNLNPLSSQFELFRYAITGNGMVSGLQILYSVTVAVIMVVAGIMIFNKMSDKLMDVI